MPRGRATNPAALLGAVAAFLLPVAFSPSVEATFWSPKMAVLLVTGIGGLAFLPGLLRSPQRSAAIAALSFLAVAALSTALCPDPVRAVVGLYDWGTGLVFLACLVGVWALGASVGDGEPLVRRALLAGVAVSAGVGLIQTAFRLNLPDLAVNGRAAGLAGNPVHLGTTAVIGAALCIIWPERRSWLLPGTFAFAAAAQVSGTRVALAVLIILALAGVLRFRSVHALLLAASVAAGLLAGGALASHADLQSATGRTVGEKAVNTSISSVSRVELWKTTRHAIARHPVLGSGPGRFRAATSADRTLTLARSEFGVLYTDAHNLFIEYVVTTGGLGLLAFLAWLVFAFRRATGPTLAVALSVLAMSLFQPQWPGTTPLLFLALGTAVPSLTTPRQSRRQPALLLLAVSTGATAAALLLVGDLSLHTARSDFDLAAGRRADVLLHAWPQPATILARAHTFQALELPPGPGRDREVTMVLTWRRRALTRDRDRPDLWDDLAKSEAAAGRIGAAVQHYRQALTHDPYDFAALTALGELAEARKDNRAAVLWYQRADAVQRSDQLSRHIVRLQNRS